MLRINKYLILFLVFSQGKQCSASNKTLDERETMIPILRKVAKSEPLSPQEVTQYVAFSLLPTTALSILNTMNMNTGPRSLQEAPPRTTNTCGAMEIVSKSLENDKNTFENFLIDIDIDGVKLVLLKNTVEAFAKQDMDSESRSQILFLYGPAGVGKTHLLYSCCKHLDSQGRSGLFIRGDSLFQHIYNIHDRMDNFLKKNPEVIIIDDLNSLYSMGEKEYIRKLFIWAFDTGGKRIAISSNISWKDFLTVLLQNMRFINSGNPHEAPEPVPDSNPESIRMLSRFQSITTVLDFSDIPTRR